ncbi:MAG: amidophosphoribosyltransferase [Bacillota bacterium]|jgi:amidophosphoribosyltransferase
MRHAGVTPAGVDRAGSVDRPREECGVFGACMSSGGGAVLTTFYGLMSLQHRGQDSAGIASADGERIRVVKGPGLAAEVFHEDALARLSGHVAIGHVRNAARADEDDTAIQPFVFHYTGGMMAVAHNGSITNGRALRERLGRSGVVFQSESDAEIIGSLIARYYSLGIIGAIERAMEDMEGAYSFLVMAGDMIYAVRDPYGFRPLAVGSSPDGWAAASETCALDAAGMTTQRDVAPGEIAAISSDGIRRISTRASRRGANRATCIFEYIYFARPDSVVDGISVSAARQAFGARLAAESTIEADAVISVPESGVAAGLGYAAASGIPYQQGIVRNRYLGRTFIRPTASQRETGVRLKLNAVEHACAGRRVVLVDDSIVRGTTSARLVSLMRRSGARQVHLGVSSPPVKFACCYGIDTSRGRELVAATKSIEEIRQFVGADSLHYLSIEGLLQTMRALEAHPDSADGGGAGAGFCTACFTGVYPDRAEPCGLCSPSGSAGRLSYAKAGVNIDEGNRAVDLIRSAVRSTFTSNVVGDVGGFAGMVRFNPVGYDDPVLVSGTDGVGTKLKIAFAMNRHDTIGIDAVAMCVNDVLASGARPLFFLDYIGCGKLEAEQIAQIVSGVAAGCREAGCALVGGETAEMPGFYPDGEYDIAGFAVGAADRPRIVDGSDIRPGDLVIGLASSGLHSNGYSLAREALLERGGLTVAQSVDGPGSEFGRGFGFTLGCTVGEEMLRPTRIYVRPVLALMEQVCVLGMAHITGGGLVENPPRMLPAGASMRLEWGSWPVHPIFQLIQEVGNVDPGEMRRVFNMGIGFMLVVRPGDAQRAVEILQANGENAYVIGEILPGDGRVSFCEQSAE